MPTKKNSERGFTLVEVAVGMGLAGVSLLALSSLTTSISNSALLSTLTSENTVLRNLIQTSLRQRSTSCPPNGNCCTTNLRLESGAEVSIPGVPPVISRDANITLAVQMGPGLLPFIKNGDVREQEKTKYRLVLTGELKRRDDLKNLNYYTGEVEVVASRRNLANIEIAKLTTQIPIDFELADSGVMTACDPRPEGNDLFRGQNSKDECLKAGGMPVPSNVGLLCRFRTAYPPPNFEVDCPEGFVDDTALGCRLDTTPGAVTIVTIPPCTDATPPGQLEVGKPLGKFYCKTVGTPNAPPPGDAPECPFDPSWDPAEHQPPDPSDPPLRWEEIPGTYDLVTGTRHCEYSQKTCPPDWQQILDPEDNVTPACKFLGTQCPSYMMQTSTNPLGCRYVPQPVAAIAPPACPSGFTQLETSNPVAQQWNSSNHVVCY